MSKFKSDCKLEDILEATKVTLADGKFWFAKPFRNAETQGKFNQNVTAALNAKDKAIQDWSEKFAIAESQAKAETVAHAKEFKKQNPQLAGSVRTAVERSSVTFPVVRELATPR